MRSLKPFALAILVLTAVGTQFPITGATPSRRASISPARAPASEGPRLRPAVIRIRFHKELRIHGYQPPGQHSIPTAVDAAGRTWLAGTEEDPGTPCFLYAGSERNMRTLPGRRMTLRMAYWDDEFSYSGRTASDAELLLVCGRYQSRSLEEINQYYRDVFSLEVVRQEDGPRNRKSWIRD